MADPQWLRGRGAGLRARAEETRQLARAVGALSPVCWVSPSATRFAHQVESRAGGLLSLAGALEEAADRLETHARAVEADLVAIIPRWFW